MDLNEVERAQLAQIIGVQADDDEFDARLKDYSGAAHEEYLRMILGQRVFTRGQDILEYRLYLLIKHVYRGAIPDEAQVSGHFQMSTSQSRALIRSVLAKYQYELAGGLKSTLTTVLNGSVAREDGTRTFAVASVNVVEALNQRIGALDGTLPRVQKVAGTVNQYEIAKSSFTRLAEDLEIEA